MHRVYSNTLVILGKGHEHPQNLESTGLGALELISSDAEDNCIYTPSNV